MSLEIALRHHEMGLALLPLGAKSKAPNYAVLKAIHGTSGWAGLGQRRASAPEIRAWHEIDPLTNIGVILGEPSGGLVVADVDRRDYGPRCRRTPTVRTGRGCHIYLRSDRPVKTRTFPWGELRGDGSYVVAPDSVHPNGGTYTYVTSHEEADAAPLRELHLPGENHDLPCGHATADAMVTLPSSPAPDAQLPYPVTELARHEEPARAGARALGILVPLGRAFHCMLPGGNERRPSASIHRHPRSGVFMYHDWHRCSGEEWLSLAGVRAALAYGRVKKLKSPELARWYLRLFFEARVIAPVPVELPPLPPASRDSTRKVAEGFGLLLGLRALTEDPYSPVPFARFFAAAWSGVGKRAAGEAISELRKRDVINKVDEYGVGIKKTGLFIVGSGAAANSRGRG